MFLSYFEQMQPGCKKTKRQLRQMVVKVPSRICFILTDKESYIVRRMKYNRLHEKENDILNRQLSFKGIELFNNPLLLYMSWYLSIKKLLISCKDLNPYLLFHYYLLLIITALTKRYQIKINFTYPFVYLETPLTLARSFNKGVARCHQ